MNQTNKENPIKQLNLDLGSEILHKTSWTCAVPRDSSIGRPKPSTDLAVLAVFRLDTSVLVLRRRESRCWRLYADAWRLLFLVGMIIRTLRQTTTTTATTK
ncbi:unnamed protein product [Amoebophrya sp. A25]|nr:unnamed protein product [Amoebophrya sp. A25]|eukprot:GSA25T00018518001.1